MAGCGDPAPGGAHVVVGECQVRGEAERAEQVSHRPAHPPPPLAPASAAGILMAGPKAASSTGLMSGSMRPRSATAGSLAGASGVGGLPTPATAAGPATTR